MANIKYNIEKVKEIFQKNNCELLEKEYTNTDTKMSYKCSCGNISKISLYNFKKGQRCKKCYIKSKTFNYKYVYNFFKEQNCELLSKKYINSTQKLKYRCSCGNISKIEFRQFKQGQRCKKCSNKRSCNTNKINHDGVLYFQTKDFIKKRDQTNLKRYGVKIPLKSSIIKLKREQTNLKRYGVKEVFLNSKIQQKIKKTIKKKYGCDYPHQSPEIRAKFKQTLLRKYGVPSLAYLSNCASKESQKLFDAIYEKMDKKYKNKTYYASLNKEFVITYNNKHFKYDYVNSTLKKAIEYNGYNFHPKIDQKDEEIGWCAFHPNKTVKEARSYEKIKYEGLEKRGYQILTVWDYESHKDFDTLVQKCLEFLVA